MSMTLRLITASRALALAGSAVAQTAAPVLKVPAESTIPSGPKGLAIIEGKKLLTETRQRPPKHVGNGLNCTSRHLAGGTTAVELATRPGRHRSGRGGESSEAASA